jgi:hypothetical protein
MSSVTMILIIKYMQQQFDMWYSSYHDTLRSSYFIYIYSTFLDGKLGIWGLAFQLTLLDDHKILAVLWILLPRCPRVWNLW